MPGQRKRYSADLKARVALEAMKGQKTDVELFAGGTDTQAFFADLGDDCLLRFNADDLGHTNSFAYIVASRGLRLCVDFIGSGSLPFLPFLSLLALGTVT